MNDHNDPIADLLTTTHSPEQKTRDAVHASVVDEILSDIPVEGIHPPRLPDGPLCDPSDGKHYTAERHVKLCKLIAFGLPPQDAAKAIGIHVSTLKRWRTEKPALSSDIEMAQHLAVGAVAGILRQLMTSENEAVALRAVIFFLKTRSKAFREKAELEIGIDDEALARMIRGRIYGHRHEPESLPSDNDEMSLAALEGE